MLKKDKKLLEELTEKRETVYNQIQELNSHIITLEDAKEHFKEHFYSQVGSIKNIDTAKASSSNLKDKPEGYEKMN